MSAMPKSESIWQRWLVQPIMTQLTQGVSPSRLSLAIAFGVTTGLFPLLGLTTLVSLAVGIPLRLNQPVLQLTRELTYPLHLATLFLFMRAGESLFGAQPVPLSIPLLTERFMADPAQFFADYGRTGLYGVIVWLLLTPLLLGMVYFISRVLLEKTLRHLPPRHAC